MNSSNNINCLNFQHNNSQLNVNYSSFTGASSENIPTNKDERNNNMNFNYNTFNNLSNCNSIGTFNPLESNDQQSVVTNKNSHISGLKNQNRPQSKSEGSLFSNSISFKKYNSNHINNNSGIINTNYQASYTKFLDKENSRNIRKNKNTVQNMVASNLNSNENLKNYRSTTTNCTNINNNLDNSQDNEKDENTINFKDPSKNISNNKNNDFYSQNIYQSLDMGNEINFKNMNLNNVNLKDKIETEQLAAAEKNNFEELDDISFPDKINMAKVSKSPEIPRLKLNLHSQSFWKKNNNNKDDNSYNNNNVFNDLDNSFLAKNHHNNKLRVKIKNFYFFFI